MQFSYKPIRLSHVYAVQRFTSSCGNHGNILCRINTVPLGQSKTPGKVLGTNERQDIAQASITRSSTTYPAHKKTFTNVGKS